MVLRQISLFHFIPFRNFFVFLQESYYFCSMQCDDDSSASGYINDPFEGISQMFTDVEILSTSEVNVVAKAKRYGRWWLLKGLRQEVTKETGYQQRLRKELEIQMQLQHPNIVTTIGLENVEGLGDCIVMEYVDGVTLKEWLEDVHSRQEHRKVLRELLEAVDYIHRKGIVHRDLKPENIIITRNGEHVKLIDFGLADADHYAVLKQPAGTPKYMSPEQKERAEANERNDIYSLGVIMEQMDLGRGFHYIINRCKAPIGQRYQSAKDIAQSIKALWKTKITLLTSGVLVVMALVSIAVWHLWGEKDAKMAIVGQEVSQARQELNDQKDSVTKMQEQLAEVSQLQDQQQANRQRVSKAIEDGKRHIEKEIAKSRVNEHLDTLTSILYLREDYSVIIQQSNNWVENYIQTIRSDFNSEELTKVSDALNHHVGKVTEEWTKKIICLKEEYDKQFTQGD